MSTKEKEVKPQETKAESPKKRRLRKKLASFTPFVKWHVNLIVCGTITRRFTNRGEYGEKENIELRLEDPCTFTTSDGEVLTLSPGDLLNVGRTAALATLMTLDVGTLVQIECVGQTKMGKGKADAWDFEVTYE